MTTLPADPETEQLARRVAEATGKPVQTVVKEAIAAKASAAGVALQGDGQRSASHDELLARITEITAEFAKLPVLDPRSAEEIMSFDESGLPS
jgi:antitoxin VapB